MKCPMCTADIPKENINIQTDIGQCDVCNNVFSISASIIRDNFQPSELDNPPEGVKVDKKSGSMVITIKHRSIMIAIISFVILVPFSILPFLAIYAPQIESGQFDLLQTLMGIPFYFVTLVLFSLFIFSLVGKTVIRIDKNGGTSFTGALGIGRNRNFIWDEISEIIEENEIRDHKRNRSGFIQIEGKKRVKFGSSMKESQKHFVYRVVNSIFRKIRANQTFSI